MAKVKKSNAVKSPKKQTTSSLKKVSSMKQLAFGKKVGPGTLVKTKVSTVPEAQPF